MQQVMEQNKERHAQHEREKKFKKIADAHGIPESVAKEAAAEGTVSGQRLKSYLERIERLEAEKAALGDDVKDVYAESKAAGFEPKIIRKLVSLRKMGTEKRREEQELLSLYAAAIGMQLDLGL